jgi:hypothetical protein
MRDDRAGSQTFTATEIAKQISGFILIGRARREPELTPAHYLASAWRDQPAAVRELAAELVPAMLARHDAKCECYPPCEQAS